MNKQNIARLVLGFLVVFSMACGDMEEEVEPQFGGEITIKGNLGEFVEKPLDLNNSLSADRDFEFTTIPQWLAVDPESGTLVADSTIQAILAAECGDAEESIEGDLIYDIFRDGVRTTGVLLVIVLSCEEEDIDVENGE